MDIKTLRTFIKDDVTSFKIKLEDECLSEICYSQSFPLGENAFYFELCPISEGSASLALWQTHGCPLAVIYLVFILVYEDKKKYFLYKNHFNTKRVEKSMRTVNVDGLYEIRTMKTKGLEEIYCICLNYETIDESNKSAGCDTYLDNDDEYFDAEESDEEESDEEDYENDNDCKQNEGVTDSQNETNFLVFKSGIQNVNAEEKEPIMNGQRAVIENLMNAFLDEEDSDVNFKVGDQMYPAHRVIIRARSSVFHAMLKHDMLEKNEGVVDIKDCDPHIFRDFLFYLYTGKYNNMSNQNVFELYHMSDKYDIKELRTECVDFIRRNMCVDNICDCISLATKHCERELLTQTTQFFVDNVKDILLTVKWQVFVKENPTEANELFIKSLNKDN